MVGPQLINLVFEVVQAMLSPLLLVLFLTTAIARPNILIIIADDMGWNDVGFHGQTQIPTPNLDALAYSGVSFTRHYTLPVCTPSRAALMTGYHPLRTGLQGYPLRAGEKTALPLNFTILPQYLKNLNYSTYLIGKWHLGYYQERFMPTERGFDYFLGYLNGAIDYFKHELTERNITGFDFRKNLNLAKEFTGQYATHIFTNETINIINNHNTSQPFFIELSHLTPHFPLEVPDNEKNDQMFGYIEDTNRRLYAGLVHELDKSVGQLIDALKKKNILNNTIIVFFSDNGGSIHTPVFDNNASNWPLRGQKFTLFEGGIRGSAALWSSNLRNPGRVYDSLFHLVDWLPTLYSAAGGDIVKLGKIDGIDQWSSITNDKKGPRTETLLNIDQQSNTAAYWKNGWKLLVGNRGPNFDGYYGPDGRKQLRNTTAIMESDVAKALAAVGGKILNEKQIEFLTNQQNIHCQQNVPDVNANLSLFNLFEDPCETTNLASTHPLMVRDLLKEIIRWDSFSVPVESKEPDPLGMPQLHGGAWSPWVT